MNIGDKNMVAIRYLSDQALLEEPDCYQDQQDQPGAEQGEAERAGICRIMLH